jgi:hypothetical protein
MTFLPATSTASQTLPANTFRAHIEWQKHKARHSFLEVDKTRDMKTKVSYPKIFGHIAIPPSLPFSRASLYLMKLPVPT